MKTSIYVRTHGDNFERRTVVYLVNLGTGKA